MKVTPERRYDFRVVALELIDPPPIAMREEMDDRALEELAADIKRNGILQPPGVIERDGRYVIVWGHRRFEAAKLAGEAAIPVRVLFDSSLDEEDLKISENRHQEPVNPMGEATYFADILERKFGGDIEQMSAAIHVPISTIDARLELLRGWPDVQAALRAGTIRLGVARELNRMKHEDWMKFRLGEAIDQGASERVVRDWRISDVKHLAMQQAEASGAIAAVPPSTEAPIGNVDTCVVCFIADDGIDMTYVKVHNDCLKGLLRRVRAEQRTGGANG